MTDVVDIEQQVSDALRTQFSGGTRKPAGNLTPQMFADALWRLQYPDGDAAPFPLSPVTRGIAEHLVVHVPGPPKIRDDATDAQMADLLARAYCGACKRRLDVTIWWRQVSSLIKSKQWPSLMRTAIRMRELDISPASWAAWRCGQWRAMPEAAGTPRINWVFNVTAVDKFAGWYKSQGVMEAHEMQTPGVRELNARYRQLEIALHDLMATQGTDLPQERVARLVAQHFPRGYEDAVAAARNATKRESAAITARLVRGEWIWI